MPPIPVVDTAQPPLQAAQQAAPEAGAEANNAQRWTPRKQGCRLLTVMASLDHLRLGFLKKDAKFTTHAEKDIGNLGLIRSSEDPPPDSWDDRLPRSLRNELLEATPPPQCVNGGGRSTVELRDCPWCYIGEGSVDLCGRRVCAVCADRGGGCVRTCVGTICRLNLQP